MRHTAYGYWVEEAGGPPERLSPLEGDQIADVVIVGGGFLGMWTAWHLTEDQPGANIALLEGDRCGCGPSGRNGGFIDALWAKIPQLVDRHGADAAIALGEASSVALDEISRWCEQQSADAWLHRAPKVEVSTAPDQDGIWDATVDGLRKLGRGDELRRMSASEVAQHCRSPLFRGGVMTVNSALVQPARLAFALRRCLIDRGVRIYEGSRATAIDHDNDVLVRTREGSVRADTCVLAINHATGTLRPMRPYVSVGSSHMVITEPVPEVLEDIGWHGGGLADMRGMLHYMRTTPDGRIAFGWGGGRLGWGQRDRRKLEVDPGVVTHTANQLKVFFPQLRDRKVTHAWGGPVDVSPTRLAQYRSVGSLHVGFGFTGAGMGPSYLGGQILSRLARGRRDEITRLCVVEPTVRRFPPEPFRFAGGSLFRAALQARDMRHQRGVRSNAAIDFVASLPERIGMNLPR